MNCPSLNRLSWANNARWLLGLSTKALLVVAILGFTADLASAKDAPYQGVITENRVDVRSGGSSAYYAVGKIKKGQLVTVEEERYDWFMIEPPKGVYSYISKGFVNRQGDGSQGVVNRDRADVKAASVKGPGYSYRTQTDLDQGDTVTIVGAEGGYYKIQPPKGVHVSVKPGSVRRATKAELAKAGLQPDKTPSADNDKASADQGGDTAWDKPDTDTQDKQAGESENAYAGNRKGPATSSNTDQTARKGTQPAASNQGSSSSRQARSSTEGNQPGQTNSAQSNASTARADQTDERGDANGSTNRRAPDTGGSNAGTQQSNPSAKAGPDHGPSKTSGANATTMAGGSRSKKHAGQTDQANATANQATSQANEAPDTRIAQIKDSDSLVTVDKKLKPLFAQPLSKQPIDRMIAAYRKFEGNENLSRKNRRMVEVRLASLRHNKNVRQALKQADEALKDNPEPEARQKVDLSQLSPDQFDAVGVLRASSVYDGNNLPRMLRIVDPSSNRTTAYVRPKKPINAKTMIGKLVGILGSKAYDSSTRLTVIEVDRIAVLGAQSAKSDDPSRTETATANP